MARQWIEAAAVGLVAVLLVSGPVRGATEAQKEAAIEGGLRYLAQNQQADGAWSSNAGYGVSTGAMVRAFARAGYQAGDDVVLGGTNYGDVVGRGLNYLFSQAQAMNISVQVWGNPDTNGNGLGVKFVRGGPNSRDTQSTGMALDGIVAAGRPDMVVTTGQLAGWTYGQVVQDTVDYFAYGQVETVNPPYYSGGWRYYANFGQSDQSCTPWAVTGLLAARQWGIEAPAFVTSELEKYLGYIQRPDGGSAYMGDGSLGSNVYRTGAFLSEAFYAEDTAAEVRVQAALGYLNGRWTTGGTDGNFANPGAMWSVFEGLAALIGTDDNSWITNLYYGSGELDPGDTWNWCEDYCQYLVSTQQASGVWGGAVYYDNLLTTAWNVDMLVSATPEPGTVLLLGLGAVQLRRRVGVRRRR